MAFYLSAVFNLIIVVGTLLVFGSYFKPRKVDNAFERSIGKGRLVYFTTLSNLFSAFACGIYLAYELIRSYSCGVVIPHWIVLLKYFSTATVAVTFFTVLFYLGPTRGYGKLYNGTSFFTHFIGPVLAVINFCFLEKSIKISLEENFVAVMPFLIYGLVYIRQAFFVAERNEDGKVVKGWEDFYSFDGLGRLLTGSNGHWLIGGLVLLAAAFVVAVIIRLLHNM